MVDQFGRVKLTNPDKVLYPATGTTKAEVFDYYVDVAEAMIPHIAGRAVTRKRWPNGVDEPAFFEKQLASSAPDWLDRVLFWREPEPYGEVVDPTLEQKRIQENQSLGQPITEGETPTVVRKEKGALEGLF